MALRYHQHPEGGPTGEGPLMTMDEPSREQLADAALHNPKVCRIEKRNLRERIRTLVFVIDGIRLDVTEFLEQSRPDLDVDVRELLEEFLTAVTDATEVTGGADMVVGTGRIGND